MVQDKVKHNPADLVTEDYDLTLFVQGPRNVYEVGVLKMLERSERSERSVNLCGVQEPAVGLLVGLRGNTPGRGPGGAEPPGAHRLQTFEYSLMGRF